MAGTRGGREITATTDKVTIEKQVLGPPKADKVTIYHKQTGKPLEVFAVDALEILNQADSEYTDTKPETKADDAKK